jgi:hypothetical protein
MKLLSRFIQRSCDFLRGDDPGAITALRRGIFCILPVLAMLSACGSSSSPQQVGNYTAFGNPELVTVTGYSGDIMEPFISRDGAYLFFNDNGSNKNIYYATFVNNTAFLYAGPISAINTSAVEGTPTMDVNNKFYYISTANYNPPTTYDTLYSGTWNGSTVTGSAALPGLAIPTPGFVNFDVEVSSDGSTLYFDDGDFSGGKSFPDTADIAIAVDSGSGFARIPNSSTIMANVNTADLEYAPAISADGLELFFTRLDLNSMGTGIYRAARTHAGDPFGTPQLVSAIAGFVEGPAFSPDEKSLYYHKLNTSTGKFELYRVTRP